jgi:hypothetical protein
MRLWCIVLSRGHVVEPYSNSNICPNIGKAYEYAAKLWKWSYTSDTGRKECKEKNAVTILAKEGTF